MQWFRMYAEFATDPKVQMLSEVDQRRYVMLLCLRCCNGDVTLHETELAFQLRISDGEWAETKANLLARNLIDEGCNVTGWDKRQYVSDSSAERVRRHRNKKKQPPKQPCNVTETPPDSETDTDTESISSLRSESSADTDPPAEPASDPPVGTAELLEIPDFLKRTDETGAAFEAWNAMAAETGLPQVQNRSDTRKKHLRARLKECGGLEGWDAMLGKVRGSAFLLGAGERGWKADFDFVVTPKQFTKIMEGGHDGGDPQQSEVERVLEEMRSEA